MKLFNSPDKSGKSSAAIFSVLCLIPAIVTLTIDYIWNYKIDWKPTGYIVGALIVLWICCVLPAIKITPAPVTALICFMSLALYLMFIVKQVSGSMLWFAAFALPAIAVLAVFIGADSAIIHSTKISSFGICSLISAEAAIYSIVWGILWDNYHHGGIIRLRFSVILASVFLIFALIFAAAAYVGKIHKK